MGQWVTIGQDGLQAFCGYLSLPPRGAGPGLLLLQEIWGVNAHIQSLADHYAADGFVVLAPDVFWRQRPRVDLGYDEAGTAQAYRYYQALEFPQACADLALAVEHLASCPSVSGKLGVLGFCLGGRLAYSLAGNTRLSAGVSYYGSAMGEHIAQTPKMAFPFLFHFAGVDHLIPVEEVRRLMPLIQATGDVLFHVYEGEKHGFNCPHRASYSRQAAQVAKARTAEFFAAHLSR